MNAPIDPITSTIPTTRVFRTRDREAEQEKQPQRDGVSLSKLGEERAMALVLEVLAENLGSPDLVNLADPPANAKDLSQRVIVAIRGSLFNELKKDALTIPLEIVEGFEFRIRFGVESGLREAKELLATFEVLNERFEAILENSRNLIFEGLDAFFNEVHSRFVD